MNKQFLPKNLPLQSGSSSNKIYKEKNIINFISCNSKISYAFRMIESKVQATMTALHSILMLIICKHKMKLIMSCFLYNQSKKINRHRKLVPFFFLIVYSICLSGQKYTENKAKLRILQLMSYKQLRIYVDKS